MMKKLIPNLHTTIKSYIKETINIRDYNYFSELTKSDLKDIAKWSIYEGGYVLYDDLTDDKAINQIIHDFEGLLDTQYPNGFKNTPNILTLYRMVKLKSYNDLNINNLGKSWFSNPKNITNRYFIDQLFNNPSPQDLYLIEVKVPISKVDIKRSLIQRTMSYVENEIVLKDDTNIGITNLSKIK